MKNLTVIIVIIASNNIERKQAFYYEIEVEER